MAIVLRTTSDMSDEELAEEERPRRRLPRSTQGPDIYDVSKMDSIYATHHTTEQYVLGQGMKHSTTTTGRTGLSETSLRQIECPFSLRISGTTTSILDHSFDNILGVSIF